MNCRQCQTAIEDVPATLDTDYAVFTFCLACGHPYMFQSGLLQPLGPEDVGQLPIEIAAVLMQMKVRVLDEICFRAGVRVLGGEEREPGEEPRYLNTLAGEFMQLGLEVGAFSAPLHPRSVELYVRASALLQQVPPVQVIRSVVSRYGRDSGVWGSSQAPRPNQSAPAGAQ